MSTDDKSTKVKCLYGNQLSYSKQTDGTITTLEKIVYQHPDYGLPYIRYRVKAILPGADKPTLYFLDCDLAVSEKIDTDVREVWETAMYNNGISAQSRSKSVVDRE